MKGQSSIEFLAMVAVSMLMLAALQSVMVQKQSKTYQFKNKQAAQKIAEYVSFQAEMALVQGDGYSRVFSIPEKIGGENYNFTLLNQTVYVEWSNQSAIQSSRYVGQKIERSSRKNVYRVLNKDGEVELNYE